MENRNTLKNRRFYTTFYGVFVKFLFRNEKTGQCAFKFATKKKLLVDKMYCEVITKKNDFTGEEEDWYVIVCDAMDRQIPYFTENTPIMVTGLFDNNKNSNAVWNFKVKKTQEATDEAKVTLDYLLSGIFDLSYEEAMNIITKIGYDIFELCQLKNAESILMEKINIEEHVAKSIVDTVFSTTLERRLFNWLAPLDIPYAYAAKGIKKFKKQAFFVMKTKPYTFGKAVGLNFAQCDRIAKKTKLSANSKDRLNAASYDALENLSNNGHIWSPQKLFTSMVKRTLDSSGVYEQTADYISSNACIGFSGDGIETSRIKNVEAVYSKKLYEAEKSVARDIVRLSQASDEEPYDGQLISYAEKACGMNYGEQQRRAFSAILSKRGVKILTGGPGTGKTTTIKGILLAYEKIHPEHVIKLCAPTGRAAQRMSESTERPATTMHRLIDYRPYGDDVIHKDESNPIEADLIVVDEVSMTDVEIFSLFLKAVKTGTTLILVGDIHQLESVGPGAILHDLLKVEDNIIQKCMLTDVFRQKGGSPIIENAMRINNGNIYLEEVPDFQIIHTIDEAESLEIIKGLMTTMYDSENPFETQILCPSKTGVSGIDNCNIVLQELLNPLYSKKGKEMIYGKTKYRINDKIIMMKNNYSADYYNGDIGIVTDIVDGGLKVNIRDKEITLTRDMMMDIRLAYGMTIHKSQGSEFPYVICVMPMQPKSMLVRNLLYTGVTRAKKKVIIITEGTAMETAIKTNHTGDRRTLLNDFIEEAGE